MRDYENILFVEIVKQLSDEKQNVIDISIESNEFLSLKYFLTRNYHYAEIIDDYPFEIMDKLTLLEALYYQVKLITMNDLNWDALQEGLCDVINGFLEFEGVCLLFKNKEIRSKLSRELETLIEIIRDINKHSKYKKTKIILNR